MGFRLPLSTSDDPLKIELQTTVGYVEHLVEQLSGKRQPIHPCLLLEIRLKTLGPRLGVYLDGTEYDKMSVGELGSRNGDSPIRDSEVMITLEIDDQQAIELQRRYSLKGGQVLQPWTTEVPKQAVEPFVRHASLAIGKIDKASGSRVNRIDCPYCDTHHTRSDITMRIEGRLMPADFQNEESFSVNSEGIRITGKCPNTGQEIDFD